MVEVGLAGVGDGVVGEVTGVVNRAYALGEAGMWVDGTGRTDEAEVAELVRAGEIAVARLDGRVVGAVRVRRLAGGEGEFGMLAAAPEHRGRGVGRELVAFAEDWARDRGLARMQLEILFPRAWAHPAKEFLRGWYTRIGYRPVRTDDFAGLYPELVPRLACDCDFVVFHKDL